MIYLASPYSHPDPDVRERRFEAACRACAKLMSCGLHAFSPIAHTHPVAVRGDLPSNFAFWEDYDRWFISRCDELWVLALSGWEESAGVAAEVRMAADLGVPVRYVDGEGREHAGV